LAVISSGSNAFVNDKLEQMLPLSPNKKEKRVNLSTYNELANISVV
jgi:hypothetical protein